MKKRKAIRALIPAFMFCCALLTAPKAQAQDTLLRVMASNIPGQVAPMAEETEWRTRIYNGVLQKRLWSKTENRWLTDWIDVV